VLWSAGREKAKAPIPITLLNNSEQQTGTGTGRKTGRNTHKTHGNTDDR